MINKKLLQNAQQVVTAALIKEGITVVYDAKVPCADLKNRIMHLRPLPEEISDKDLLHLRADCDHEMGHFWKTDPDAIEKVENSYRKLLLNVIEDGFIEREVRDEWFGCGENLAASNKAILRENRDNATDEEENIQQRSLNALQMIVFGDSVEEAVATLGDDIQPNLDLLEPLLEDLRAVAATSTSAEMAEKVHELWSWDSPEESGGGSGDEECGGDSSEEGTTGSPSKGRGDGDSKAARDLAEKLSKGLTGKKRREHVTQIEPKSYITYFPKTDLDRVSTLKPDVEKESLAHFLADVKGVVPALRRRLLMEFRGVGTTREFDQRSGELDRESLHHVALGNTNIFTQETPHHVPDADITLLIDASGSMSYGVVGDGEKIKAYVAAQAAAAFSNVLDLINVQNECLAFTTRTDCGREWVHDHVSYGGQFTRVCPLEHIVIKTTTESYRAARSRFASITSAIDFAENIDGESVMWAARRLAARNRLGMRPVLIVFSDGEPASTPEGVSVLSTHLRKTVKRVEAAGIRVIGVGIGTTSVQRYYKNHVVLNDVKDLVGTSYRIIRNVLRQAKVRV